MPFQVGDRVRVCSPAVYGPGFPKAGVGTVVQVRLRYEGTPAEYRQYQIHVDGYDTPGGLNHMYDEMDVESTNN